MSSREYSDVYSRGSKSIEKSRDDRYRVSKDDSRDRHRRSKRDRSRSLDRSNRRSRSREDKYRSKQRLDRNEETDTMVREMSISPTREEERIPSPPPPPQLSKITIGFNKTAKPAQPIKLSLSSSNQNVAASTKPSKVASVFGDGSDEEPEEMPAEARMRMRNIGRDTPTSAGPNSFGKTKHGFCDPRGTIQKNLKDTVDQANPGGNSTLKYSSTVYK